MLSGAKQLSEWMERRGFNLEETADFFGWDPTFISKLTNGRRLPGLRNAMIIEDKTGIPARAWMSSRLDGSTQPVFAGARKSKRTK